MALDAVEIRRKAVHISMGGFAFALRFLTFPQAVAAALGAVFFNFVVLPRAGGAALDRDRDRERGYPVGILLYPLVVLALILLYRDRLEVAALGWAFLAFGDGLATLAGKAFGGPRLPWNERKSWCGSTTYVLSSLGFGAAALGFVARRAPTVAELLAVAVAAVAAAAVESLPSEIDDNLLPPLVGAMAFATFSPVFANPAPLDARWLAVGLGLNVVVALVSGGLSVVRPSGALAGLLFGSLIYAFGGPRPYVLLWIFFGLGTLATRYGRKRKEAMGKAEPGGGKRGAENVFANVTVGALGAVAAGLSSDPRSAGLLQLATAAAFATALADTVGTEVGQAIRTKTVLLPDFKPVPPGTDGAVSLAGTLAGLLAAALVALAAAAMGLVSASGAGLVVVAAFAGSTVESLLGRDGAPWRVTNGHVLNLYNTLAGAWLAHSLGRLLS